MTLHGAVLVAALWDVRRKRLKLSLGAGDCLEGKWACANS